MSRWIHTGFLSAVGIVTALIALAPRVSEGAVDSSLCALTYGPTGSHTGIAPKDTLRALFVLARFADEVEFGFGGGGCTGDPWPATAVHVPSEMPWFDELLENPVDPTSFTPQIDHSLTKFFYEMSGGQHLLLGDVYDNVMTVPAGVAQVCPTLEVAVDSVVAYLDAEFDDFADFDYPVNGLADGEVDFFIIWFRQQFTAPAQGWTVGGSSGSAGSVTRPVDGGTVVLSKSATIYTPLSKRNIKIPRMTAIHEYGHYLLTAAWEN